MRRRPLFVTSPSRPRSRAQSLSESGRRASGAGSTEATSRRAEGPHASARRRRSQPLRCPDPRQVCHCAAPTSRRN
jgi:hypothetical protein